MDEAIFSRRSFLRLAAGAAASGLIIPAVTPPREPYVAEGEVVSYVGLAKGGFIGAAIVLELQAWDGVGYPCVLSQTGYFEVTPDNGYRFGGREMADRYYDSDLANLVREVPPRFWHSRDNCRKYPNVHAYVREQRFGENPRLAWDRLVGRTHLPAPPRAAGPAGRRPA